VRPDGLGLTIRMRWRMAVCRDGSVPRPATTVNLAARRHGDVVSVMATDRRQMTAGMALPMVDDI